MHTPIFWILNLSCPSEEAPHFLNVEAHVEFSKTLATHFAAYESAYVETALFHKASCTPLTCMHDAPKLKASTLPLAQKTLAY